MFISNSSYTEYQMSMPDISVHERIQRFFFFFKNLGVGGKLVRILALNAM